MFKKKKNPVVITRAAGGVTGIHLVIRPLSLALNQAGAVGGLSAQHEHTQIKHTNTMAMQFDGQEILPVGRTVHLRAPYEKVSSGARAASR